MNAPVEAPNPFRKRPSHFNSLKLRALGAFENRGWINPTMWAVLVGFYPARAAYTYLLRLWRFGLLERGRGANGLVFYRLSNRGEKRLRWLRSENEKQ